MAPRAAQLTSQRIELIKEIWKPGMSARDIAAQISARDWGGPTKPTRNAVVGLFARCADRLKPATLKDPTGPGRRPPGSGRKRTQRQILEHAQATTKAMLEKQTKVQTDEVAVSTPQEKRVVVAHSPALHSPALHAQQMGRGKRLDPQKRQELKIVIDGIDSYRDFKSQVGTDSFRSRITLPYVSILDRNKKD